MANNTGNTAQPDAAQKLALVFAPLIKQHTTEIISEITKVIIAQTQEVLISQGDLRQEIRALEKNLSAPKKQIAREKKQTPAEPVVLPDTPVRVEEPSYSSNKLVWIRNKWKKDPQFRERFMTPEIINLISADPAIASKAGDQKLIAEATFYWNYAKEREDLLKAIIELHNIAKEQHELANKAQQQVAEGHTPPQNN